MTNVYAMSAQQSASRTEGATRTPQTGETVVVSQTATPTRAVIYLHGWRTDAERDVDRYNLDRKIRRTDVLIAPSGDERSQFGAFEDDLIGSAQEAAGAAGVRFPGTVVIVAHSGGYRAAARALTDSRLDGVALLDATYGEAQAYLDALRGGLPMFVATSAASRDTQDLANRLKLDGADARLGVPATHDAIVPATISEALASLSAQQPEPSTPEPYQKPPRTSPLGEGSGSSGGGFPVVGVLVGLGALVLIVGASREVE